ncbi:MAG: glycosyltransferase family 1 protein [Nitrospirota bacterium]
MRVLLNTKPLVLSNRTGVGYYVFNLYRELLKSGIEVIPTLDTGSQRFLNSLSRLSSRLRILFGKWYPPIVKNVGDTLIGHLFKRETASSYDLYHETSLDLLPEMNITKVCNLYDLSFVSCPDYLTEDFAHYAKNNVIKNVQMVKRIMVNSQFIKDEATDFLKIPDEKIDIIPLAPSSFYRQLGKGHPKPEEVTRFTEKDYLLYVGTVEPRKNLKTLIRAFKYLRERYDLSLIIAGALGWLYDDIISYPEELGIKGDVIFTRYVDEKLLLSLYNHASIFIYPSLYEGFGLPPLEAMACGVPIIISDIQPLRELTGDAALAFDPKEAEGLMDLIDKLISSESLRSEMIQRGLRKVREYSWENVAALTIQTYRRAIET